MVTFDERGHIKDRFGVGKYGRRGEQSFDLEDVDDVCQLIKHHKLPNGKFGDDECFLWEVIVRELGIDTSKWH